MGTLLVLLIGVLGGIAAGLQSQFVGVLDDRVGTLGSTLITYGSGGVIVGLIFVISRQGDLSNARQIPWWAWFAGLMGVIIIGSLSITVSNLGVGRALTLFTATSIITAAVIDQFGFIGAAVKGVDLSRGVGIALLLAGTWLVVR
jgi:transporter family-2 protein